MTRRGRRSVWGQLKHPARLDGQGKVLAAGFARLDDRDSAHVFVLGRINAELAYDQRHEERRTYITAHCRRCGHVRADIPAQWLNARHPDGRLRAEAVILAVAYYQSCGVCGCAEVDLLTIRELAVRRRVRGR